MASVAPLPSTFTSSQVFLSSKNKSTLSKKNSLVSKASSLPLNYPFIKLYFCTTLKEKLLIWISFICSVLSGALSPVFALIAGSMAAAFTHDNIQQGKSIGLVWRNSVSFGFAGITALLTNFVSIGIMKYVSQKINFRLQKAYFRALMKQELEWFDYQDSQELGRKGEMDCKLISDGTEEKLIQVIAGFASFFGGLIVSLVRGWKLTLILLPIVPFQILAALGFAYFVKKSVQSNLSAYGEAGTIAEHAFHSLGTLVSLAAEDKECARYNQAIGRNKARTTKLGFWQGICIGFFHVTLYIFHILCFIIGFIFIDNQVPGTDGIPYDPSDVITIFFALFRGGFSLAILGPGVKAVVEAKRATGRIFAILERKSKIDAHPDSESLVLSNFQGKISFKNVSFGHSSEIHNKIIKGISLDIEAGQRVVLLGQSGCGKSTLLRLLIRLYDIQEGTLEIDGIDIKSIDLNCLRTNISFLTQECPLFIGTVRENLEMGREDATEEEMIEALKKAYAYDFIMKLEKGLDTELGSGGVNLSGGQRQRLALARTLLRNGKIILLDEATASVDNESEAELVKLFESMKKEGKTLVIATHIVENAKNADKIVFLENGHIIEVGTHENLLEMKGAYYKLWKAQNNWKMNPFDQMGAIEDDTNKINETPQTDDETESNDLQTEIKGTEESEKDKNYVKKTKSERVLKNKQSVSKENEEKDKTAFTEKKKLNKENSYKIEKAKSAVLNEELSHSSKIEEREAQLHKALAQRDEIITSRLKKESILSQLNPLSQLTLPRKTVSENLDNLFMMERSRTITAVFRRESRQWNSAFKIQKEEKKASFIEGLFELFKLNKTLRKLFLTNAIISAVNGVLTPIFGYFIGTIAYDMFDPEIANTISSFKNYGPWILCIMIASFILYTFQFTAWTILAQDLNSALRSKLFNKMLRMHIAWHENVDHSPSALCNVLSIETASMSKLINFVIGIFVQAVSSMITASIIGSLLCWQITLLSLSIVPVILLVILIQTKVGAKMVLKTQEKKLATYILSEMVQNIITVTTLNENALRKRYEKVFKRIHKRSTIIGGVQGFLIGLNQCVVFFYFAGVFYYGAYLSSYNISDTKEVFTVLFATLFGVFNVFATLQLSPDIRTSFRSLKVVFQYLLMESEIDINDTENCYAKPIKGDIEFKNVTFTYPGRKRSHQGLKNVSFKIQAGKKVALVGLNGSGKSTIFKLLLRFYDVNEGEILVDGVNIKEFDLRHLRRALGLVEQVPRLFYGSIEYNIKCGAENPTDEEMIEAAKTANAYEFIQKNEFINRRGSVEKINYGEGFQRMVGGEDTRLSKGQRQRIAIARAVVSRPTILLLDEATSALDAHNEVLIDEAMNKLMENLTSVIITHRPMTLKKVDQILYVSENEVILKENH